MTEDEKVDNYDHVQIDNPGNAFVVGRRAYVIRVLRAFQDKSAWPITKTSLERLSKHVAAEEFGVDSEDVSEDLCLRMQYSLHSDCLPKPDELGLIDFDSERHSIEVKPAMKIFTLVILGRDFREGGGSIVRTEKGSDCEVPVTVPEVTIMTEIDYNCPNCGSSVTWSYDETGDQLQSERLTGCPGEGCTEIHEISIRKVNSKST